MLNKIHGVGLDLSTTTYNLSPPEIYPEVVHLQLRSGNEYLLTDYVGPETQLVVTTDFMTGLEEALGGILSIFQRDSIDVLLVRGSIDPVVIRSLVDNGKINAIGVSHPQNIRQLEKKVEILKQVMLPSYLALDLCPLHYDPELLKTDLEIMCFNPFGGRFTSQQAIECFTVPYLLEFAARISDVVFLSGRDIPRSEEQSGYLRALIGKESNDQLFSLDVGISRLVRPLRPMIKTSILGIPFTGPEFLFSPEELKIEFSDAKQEEDPGNEKEIPEELKKLFDDFSSYLMATLKKPETENPADIMACFRPGFVLLLIQLFGPEWKITPAYLGPTSTVYKFETEVVKKRFLKKSEKVTIEYNIVLWITEEGNPRLKIIQNTLEQVQEP